jgi:bifunctional non-homologous end joining protein LigD
MTDQLSLLLETDLPNLPEAVRPMLPRPLSQAFDSADHLFEPSWGGLRALAFIGPSAAPGGGQVRLVDGEGRDVGSPLVELAGLAVRVDARSAVLDGELDRRMNGGPGRPVAFLAFDLLHLDGRSLLSTPLTRRRQMLRRVLRPGDEVVAVPAIPLEGRALFDAVVAQGIAGVMARERASPYLPGVRSRLWRFVPAAPVKGRAAVEDAEEPPFEGPANGPVLALIRRLPLLDEDD